MKEQRFAGDVTQSVFQVDSGTLFYFRDFLVGELFTIWPGSMLRNSWGTLKAVPVVVSQKMGIQVPGVRQTVREKQDDLCDRVDQLP